MKGRTAFHFVATMHYILALTYDHSQNNRLPAYKSYGGRYKFLTMVNMVLQTTFFAMSLLADLLSKPSSGKIKSRRDERGHLERARDFLFASLAFPLATFVTVMFWTLYFIDRELVYPKAIDELVPPFINLIQHLFIAFWILLDCIFTNHRYPSIRNALAAVGLFGLCYMSWVFWVAHHANFWIYPVLAVLGNVQRVFFFILCFGVLFLFFFIGRWLNNLRWSTPQPVDKKGN